MRDCIAALLFVIAGTVPAAAMEPVSSAHAAEIAKQVAQRPDSAKLLAFVKSSTAVRDENVIEESTWEPEPQLTPRQKERFSRMQSDELAARLGFEDGKADWVKFDLKDEDGNGPTFAGGFDGSAAMLKMRWKQN